MARKKKNFWYVLVMADSGPTFVTKVNYYEKTAEWKKDGCPLEMSMKTAKDLTLGLNLNFHTAFSVCQPFELTSQPYNYDEWTIDWKKTEKEEE